MWNTQSMIIFFIVPRVPTITTIENCMKLCPMIVQGFWEFKNPLLQLPHITEDNLKYFHAKKVLMALYQILSIDHVFIIDKNYLKTNMCFSLASNQKSSTIRTTERRRTKTDT